MPPSRASAAESSVGPIRQPKGISRVNKNQATACASCRSRRPTLISPLVSTPPSDEIRDVKPPKLLRRGRKIQELERIFGVAQNERWSPEPEPTLERYAPPPPSAVPTLEMPFFNSKFYRPIVDPVEFVERFQRHVTQGAPLGIFGELIAKLLATWAASYGVNVRGEEEPHDGLAGVERRRAATNIMVQELLATIDRHAVMRSISWDGVRALLLLIPLTEEVQSDADRATMYQSTVLQVYSLSTMSDALQRNETGQQVDQMVRARIFWYGHVHEGLTNGLKGKKLIFDQDDVDAFKSPLSVRDYSTSLAKSPVTNSYTFQFATAPIRLSAACRMVNATLTGPKADRAERVDRTAMDRVWTALAACWEEFEGLRSLGGTSAMQNEETDRFISGWQIFIFEALNVVRERLQERISRIRNSRIVPTGGESPSQRSKLTDLEHLHDIAESRCQDVLPQVMELIRRHVGTAFFEYDASLCRDGVFYAGERIAGEPNSGDDVHVCLQALGQMRWAYSKSTQRTEKLKSIWQNRQAAVAPLPPVTGGTPPPSHPALPPMPQFVPVPPPLSGGPAAPMFDPLAPNGPPFFSNTTYPVPGADNVRHPAGPPASIPGIELSYSNNTYNPRSQTGPSSSGLASVHHGSMAVPPLVKPEPAPLDYPYGPLTQVHSLDPIPLPRLQNPAKPGPGPSSPTSPLSMPFPQSSYPPQPPIQPSYYGSEPIPQRGYIEPAMGSSYYNNNAGMGNTGIGNSVDVDYFPGLLHFDAIPFEQQDMRPSLARTVTSASGHLQRSSQTGTPPHYTSGIDIPYDPSLNSTSARPPASSVPGGHSFYPS
ncbi:hypothetical protein FS837_010793 [Tulasnella sp. UAMH 9824]|nr:hypothetical protein FS837_010793 [Tulasnella sp. UAMH 9824]